MSDDNNSEHEEQHTEEISRQGRNYLQHMNTISSSIARRFHDLQNNPRHANVLGEELSRSFLFNVRHSAQNQRDRRGRAARSSASDMRISSSFKAQITCLQDPCVTRINTNLHLDNLTSVGLGVPITERAQSHLGRSRQTTSMPTDWSADQMREFIYSIFIPLRGYSYQLCFSSVGGNLENIPSDCDTPKKLKTFFHSFRRTAGKIFIRPDRFITTTPQTSENSSLPSTSSSLPSTSSSLPSTSSSLPSTSGSSCFVPTDERNQPRSDTLTLPSTSGMAHFVPPVRRNQPANEERSDNSTLPSTSGISRFIPTSGRNQPASDERSDNSTLPSTSGISRFIPTSGRNQPASDERSDNSTLPSTSGISRFIPTSGRNQPASDERSDKSTLPSTSGISRFIPTSGRNQPASDERSDNSTLPSTSGISRFIPTSGRNQPASDERSDNSTLPSTSGISRFIPTSGRNQPASDERSDNSTLPSTSGISRFIPTSGRNQPASDERSDNSTLPSTSGISCFIPTSGRNQPASDERSDNSTLPSTSGISCFIPTSGRNQPASDERSDNSTLPSTSGISCFIPNSGRNQPESDEDGMAILIRPGERRRRQAAQIARNNIRGWCSNRGSNLQNENVQRNDSNTTSSVDSIISGSNIDNQGLSVTELRSQQDEEYLQSLIADQKKEQDKKEEEERLQNYQLRQQSLVAEIQKLRKMRKESLPSEPDEGFVLKLRSGEKRRFRQSDFVQVLINFVGCQQNATKDFEISIAGISRKINSWSSNGMLEDFGIQHSAILEVEYDIERPCTSINSLVNRSYNELMSSLESPDERESSEEEPMETDLPPPVRESCDIRDTILEWKLELIDLDNFQTIKVSRRPESLWEHSLRCFQRSSFDVRKLLKVEFRNESGQDEGGLRREFLEILFRQMLCSSLLKDTGVGYEVTSNMMGMVNGHFHTFGKMLGTILIQGGPVSPAFSHMMVNYGLKGLDSATVDSVQDANCKNVISKIQDADYPEHLMEDESVMNVLEAAGICTILNPKTKSSIVKALILSNSDILRKQPMLEAFWEGAECVGLKTLLQNKQGQLEKILCHRCGKPPKISAEILMEMVDVSTFGRSGSNARHNSEDVAQNFESFVHDCEDGTCTYDGGVVKVDDVLRFITGCSTVPPGGFDARFSIGFTEERKYPTVSTCTFEVVLPLHLKNYNTFKDIMIESIVSGPGFGQI